jgi:hypothetical protein
VSDGETAKEMTTKNVSELSTIVVDENETSGTFSEYDV